MLKTVFVDYTGTLIKEDGADIQQVIARVCKNSDEKNPQKVVGFWWEMLKKFEGESFGDAFRTEDEIVDLMLDNLVEKFCLKDNLQELHTLVQRFWMYAPAFADTEDFLKKCPLPVYIISNNGKEYLEEGMRDKNLHPAGIVCGDMVRAYKPRRELFEKALEISGCAPVEAVHIGDSYASDVLGARGAGIRPILLDRQCSSKRTDVTTVHSLVEALDVIKQMQ